MPVNWTSGKARLAKSKFKKWSKKPWKGKKPDSTKWPLPPRRRRPIANKLAPSEPTNSKVERSDGFNEPAGGSRRSGSAYKTSEVDEHSETISVEKRNRQSSVNSGQQNTSSIPQRIDIEKKRRALLALPDWAGLHIPSQSYSSSDSPTTPHYARLRGNEITTTPKQVTAVKQRNDHDGVGNTSECESDLDTSIHPDLRSQCTVSLSPSSRESIVSPTPTNPRVRKPALKVFEHKSRDSVGSKVLISSDVRSTKTNPKSASHELESFDEGVPSNQRLSSTSTQTEQSAQVSRPAVPSWMGMISESLGFSPPRGMCNFEKKNVLDVESKLSFDPLFDQNDPVTPDSKLLIKSQISPESDVPHPKSDKISEEDLESEESPDDGAHQRGEEDSDEDDKKDLSGEGTEEEVEENGEQISSGYRSRRSLSCQPDDDDRLIEQTHLDHNDLHTSAQLGNSSPNNGSYWRWNNLIQKSNDDQFDLLFRNRIDDERIF
ncbi:hypothetical protein H4Q26_018105 [Puccinia striiformis f. sp. tritici PST-130]|nr:hypothetical protein Pst134EB_002112 [Puccinia striiformis f. sp. tritici]KAI9628304.1 hypothetical protein H4Q26_018105 [Puccinia striiformis f. sp. tritici PST-130]